jgi:hypothetical protein
MPISRLLSFRAGYTYHLFRNSDYGDRQFHPRLAHIQQPTVGMSWKF